MKKIVILVGLLSALLVAEEVGVCRNLSANLDYLREVAYEDDSVNCRVATKAVEVIQERQLLGCSVSPCEIANKRDLIKDIKNHCGEPK